MARTGWFNVRIMWLSETLHHHASGLVSKWSSTIKLPWVCTVTSWYPSWYDIRCCKDIKLHQPTKGPRKVLDSLPKITTDGTALNAVDKFTYLGITLSRNVHIDDEITLRLRKASSVIGRVHTKVWRLKLQPKLHAYQTVVLTALFYACESWTWHTAMAISN